MWSNRAASVEFVPELEGEGEGLFFQLLLITFWSNAMLAEAFHHLPLHPVLYSFAAGWRIPPPRSVDQTNAFGVKIPW